MRVRGFTQDDAHIFCTPEQAEQEMLNLLDFTECMLRQFGFNEYHAYLSTRDPKQPKKYMGSEVKWRLAQDALATALKKKRTPFKEMPGEAVFYGPKIDLNIVDTAGREWQCTTIQFDFNLSLLLVILVCFSCWLSIGFLVLPCVSVFGFSIFHFLCTMYSASPFT